MKPGFTDRLLYAFGLKRIQFNGRRSTYHGASTTRLEADWNPINVTGDSALYSDNYTIRARARQQERDNDYARRYYQILDNNVLGHSGLSLSVKARRENGLFDKPANMLIEEAWAEWGELGNCTVSGEESWLDVQSITLRRAGVDGNMLVRILRGSQYTHGIALQLLEVDMLDLSLNTVLPNGNYVIFGIEKNPVTMRRVAYHFLTRHPGDFLNSGYTGKDRIRVPAEDVIHYYVKERPTQSIGIPWLCSASVRLNHLGKYEEAELRAARAGAEKGGYFKTDGQLYNGPTVDAGTDREATLSDFEPSSFEELPPGMDFVPYDPKHPMDQFPDFIRATLYGICAGGGVSYATLTGDLSQANYSSMRSGKLEEQEAWKRMQSHLIQHFAKPIFSAWLEQAILTGRVNLPFAKFSTWNKPVFKGRRWPWVDPQKDITAKIEAINNGLESKTSVLEESGQDIEDVYETIAEENQLAAEYGLSFPANQPEKPEAEDVEADDKEDENEDEKQPLRSVAVNGNRLSTSNADH